MRGSSTSSASVPAPPMRSVPAWALVAAALALVGIATAAVAMGGGESPTPTTAVAETETVAAAGPPEPAIPEGPIEAPPPAAPDLVEVAFDSVPPGAEVRDGDRVLGTTPFFADLAPGAPVRLVFRRDGYLDLTHELVPAPGAPVSVRLRPRRRASSDSSSGSSLPIKTEL